MSSPGSKSNILVTILMVILAVAASAAVIFAGPVKGVMVPGAVIGLFAGGYAVINFRFGFYAAIALGFFIFFAGRLAGQEFPSAFLVDILVWASFLGMLIEHSRKRVSVSLGGGHIISYGYLVYTLFLVGEAFNPNMASIEGWFFVLRKFLQFVLIYIIALNVFSDLRKIYFFIRFWATLSLIAGFYGCFQEWFGFFDFELDWVWSVPGRAGLYFLDNGMFRKFSILSDPAAFGIIMGSTFLVLLVMTLHMKKRIWKAAYAITAFFVILGVGYSGTRTAYFVIAAGVALYILMNITNKRTLVFASFCFLAFGFILYGPVYGNATINRIRTTFEFSEDASLKVRDENRHFIQPYIYRNPMGGGLATSGIAGLEYNPGHTLAGFPPDSGFVKTAIETGWIGFFLQCLLYFLILKSGVQTYYRSRNKYLRIVVLAAVVGVFTFIIAQYGQEAIGQVPGCFLFYSCLAIFVQARKFETSNKNI